ncbi:hypothetical protein B0H13DRAFT_1923113 [Mycena leptocephala]|nr:hypothetical protein B0H13DRAFT_1923113 [Mycena leptocephala]
MCGINGEELATVVGVYPNPQGAQLNLLLGVKVSLSKMACVAALVLPIYKSSAKFFVAKFHIQGVFHKVLQDTIPNTIEDETFKPQFSVSATGEFSKQCILPIFGVGGIDMVHIHVASKDFTPTVQAEALELFAAIPHEKDENHPFEDKIIAVEWAIIHLVATLYSGDHLFLEPSS